MITVPDNMKKIDVEGSTVDFFEFQFGGDTYYMFDTSMTAPPEPMVNAMVGLRLLDDAKKKLVMINHKNPGGLFSKIGDDFEFEITERDDGLFEIVFGFKGLVDMDTPKYTSSCHG